MQAELTGCTCKVSAVLRPAEAEKEGRPIVKRVKRLESVHIDLQQQTGPDGISVRGLIDPIYGSPRYCEFRICGTNGVAARPKCGCELSPRPYIILSRPALRREGGGKRKQPRDVDLEAVFECG